MYVKTRLGRWFYEERGRARHEGDPAIALWHSFLCDGGMWNAQLGPLSELGRVIVFDGPGHGKSEGAPPFSLWENADAAVDAMRELGIAKFVWCGLSWGGMVGMRLALSHPERVAGLALLDTSARKDTRRNRLQFALLSQIVRPFGIPEALFRKMMATKLLGPKTLRERPEVSSRLYAQLSRFPIEGVYQSARAILLERDDIEPRLGEIRCPTIVVHGEDDWALPMSCARAMASGIPNARLVTIPDSGHLSAVEAPDAVNAVLVPFVRERMISA
jgi:3-oxoadipate enol-lactonase